MPESAPHDRSTQRLPPVDAAAQTATYSGSAPTGSQLTPEKLISEFLRREKDSEKYIIDDKIGQGGMGAIYKVNDQDLRRTSVLKVILPGVLEDEALFCRFIEEAQITGQLEHPNIVPVHELGVLGDNKLYFSMKFVQGEALGSVLKSVRDNTPGYEEKYSRYILLTIFRKVCDAVAYAHSKNIIHRDIKPDNIMVGEYGEVLLMDWGLARPMTNPENDGLGTSFDTGVEHSSENDAMKTRYGVVKGTPAYMAPEQAKGLVSEIDHRSDIFLLGATLYAMVTFKVPFTGDDIYEILANAENGNYIKPGRRAPERQIPEELCRIIEKSMALEQDDRYQSVDELCVDIDNLLAGNTGSHRKIFEARETIMYEGDPGYEAYVILTGKVEVTKTVRGKSIKLITLGEGDVMGEMALILQAPRSASVTAIDHTEVEIITEETMKQGLRQLPPWMGKVVDSLAERLRAANATVHPLMNADCSYHVLNQIRLLYTYWGQPKIGPKAGEAVVVLETAATIREIASNLSLTKERVSLVISRLLEDNLLSPYVDDQFFIPNFDLFCEFIDYCRKQIGLKCEFDRNHETSLLINKYQLVVEHTDAGTKNKLGSLTEIKKRSAKELLACQSDDQTQKRFDSIITQLRFDLATNTSRNRNATAVPPRDDDKTL